MPVPTTQRHDVHIEPHDRERALIKDVQDGLGSRPYTLPPKWFYDSTGSELFDQITTLAEYYPTRTERAVLESCVSDIAEATGAHTVVELGSGSSEKTRLLLDALQAHGTLRTYVAQDVSESALTAAMNHIMVDYPGVDLHSVVSDFSAANYRDGLHWLPDYPHRLLVFLGGTIGNLVPAERAHFFGAMRELLHDGEHVLLGAGLIIDETTMVAAYDDARGVTADFNRNVLSVMNAELGADFDVHEFDHVSLWDAENQWIEMHLRARKDMTVQVPGAGVVVNLEAGETIRTEVSAKFELSALVEELAAHQLHVRLVWQDPDSRFAVLLAEAAQ
ncbi:L-histidine N(alpha)-methyltransferase [Hoyosella rhizosphaerae]|uniref:Histidine N-alpha-methyltransferase n=1 Tax=Hoyosella rhizosphaerae TaxID=1755582 RepID=A0A916XA93_9ACTN|nr:L-histidine N(alpha)-methyltransferase [Hoyosella rhizosphaerae]MBN4926775.1 L-histidine N(alpha)-methyltransferase [Hoyosella rhizosphaerae]GGC56575.1 histidine N-alpha-methyltransferase [Hoyosella rhizosphaerae]